MATKHEELDKATRGEGCLGKAKSDEPIFILRAQDNLAAQTVREWAKRAALRGCPDEKVTEAMELASKMDDWRLANGGKYPD